MTTRWLPLVLGVATAACADDRPLPTEADANLVVRRWLNDQPSETCAEGELTVRPSRFVLQQAYWLDGAVQVVAVMTGESHGVCPGAGPWAKAVHARLLSAPTGWVLYEPPILTGLPESVIGELAAAEDAATRRQLGVLCRLLADPRPLDEARIVAGVEAERVEGERVDVAYVLGRLRPEDKVPFLQGEAARVGGVDPSCAAAFSRLAPPGGGQGD